ncbi:MAG: HAD family hydrolase [Phycisphaerae bacterium]|nr:HAD family hydrolase [Phycisphaerae bacterium]
MPYQFFQVVGLEKPADLRRARRAVSATLPSAVTCWVDPLDQVVWLERADQPFAAEETAAVANRLNAAGFSAVAMDQSQQAGPACIASHRRRRFLQIRNRLLLAVAICLPVVLLHSFGYLVAKSLASQLALAWIEAALTLVLFLSAGRAWFLLGLRSLRHHHWRWRTAISVVLAGNLALAAADLMLRTLSRPPLVPGLANESLLAPACLVLVIVLLRALLMRWRLAQISRPFDRWLADMTPLDEINLRFFLQIQARHQQSGPDLTFARLGDRFTDVGLAIAAGVFVAALMATSQLLAAWLIVSGLLLILDPRLFQFTWVAPEVLAERQAVGFGVFFCNPRMYQTAAKLTCVAFDKTGTVTSVPADVVAIEVNPLAALDLDGNALLRLAAAVEGSSSHAVARSLVTAAALRGLDLPAAADIARKSGMGVAGTVEGRRVRIGSEYYMIDQGLDPAPFAMQIEGLKREPYSILLVAVDDQVAGAIGLADVIRPGSEQAVAELNDMFDVRMITGDSATAGANLAAQLGIGNVVVELSPEGKLDLMSRWSRNGDRVAMVGELGKDPALMDRADLGIALGGELDDVENPDNLRLPAHAALSTPPGLQPADVLILNNRIEHVPTALRLARRVTAQRRHGTLWMAGLVMVSALLAILWPQLPLAPELGPVAVAALSLLGLPVILGRAAVQVGQSCPCPAANGGQSEPKTVARASRP